MIAQADKIDAATVAGWLALFVAPGQVTELRAVDVRTESYRRPHVVSGFFDGRHLHAMAEAALRLTRQADGVYFVPNPLEPALLARRANRVAEAGREDLAADRHVRARRWLLVDCDPVRPVPGISATRAEKAAAWEVAERVRLGLAFDGLPDPVVADSGNGYHLLYRLGDVPAADRGACQRFLQGLAARHDSDRVTIDTSVYNPARVVKLYGTWARKGDSVPERPHRQSQVLWVPDGLGGCGT